MKLHVKMPNAERRAREAEIGRRKSREDLGEVVESAEGYIVQHAWKWINSRRARPCDLDDLISEGRMGALKAAQLFDPGMGFLFLTYAHNWIYSYQQRWVFANSGALAVPAGSSAHRKRWLKGADPGTFKGTNLIARLGPVSDVSLDAPRFTGSPEGTSIGDSIPDERPLPDETMATTQSDRAVNRAVNLLPRRERIAVQAWMNGKTLAEVARSLDGRGGKKTSVSRERVRQLKVKALQRLRGILEAQGARP